MGDTALLKVARALLWKEGARVDLLCASPDGKGVGYEKTVFRDFGFQEGKGHALSAALAMTHLAWICTQVEREQPESRPTELHG